MASAIVANYIPTIGIECHVQLNTKTKLFAAVSNDAREAAPNTLISHICVGMPGALPVLNEKAIELAVVAASALNTEPQRFSKFDRKHYFYPDLPKGYQITQYDQPIILGGYVEIEVEGEKKNIGITRVHLEEDAGKTIHPEGADYSLVDLNRAGTPMLEIVSEPDIHSAAEAKAYARELWLLMRYAGVTDGDLYHGHVRFDVNISIGQGSELGKRTEIKNLNSFRSVQNAVDFEIKRQIELVEKAQKIFQETRGWDEAKQKTTSQREKEEAHDYRYFPEPDIPPIELSEEFISRFKGKQSDTLSEKRTKLKTLNVDKNVVEDILDQPEVLTRIIEAAEQTSIENARHIAFQLLEDPHTLRVNVKDQIKLADMVNTNQLSSTAGKQALKDIASGKSLDDATRSRLQESDEGVIEKIVQAVLNENPKAVEDVKRGEMKAIGFLVGEVMKKSQGKANPGVAQQIIKRQLGL
jgi:aspartyl-tRNA(Asn)/glutamyl-tRNA(Gln) amidotransferase subunit B